MWAAGDISVTQLEGDVKLLTDEVAKVANELNVGVPLVRSQGGEAMAVSLQNRLSGFLGQAQPRLAQIQQDLATSLSSILGIMETFGEKPKKAGSGLGAGRTIGAIYPPFPPSLICIVMHFLILFKNYNILPTVVKLINAYIIS